MNLQTLVAQLNSASKKYGVPSTILLGVFGMETAFGSDVKTSSTGAEGTMQFEPATARQYGYPMTNNPTPAQAQAQFDASAHYLSDLFKQHGSWDAALKAYSGGGYGLSQVQAKASSAMGTSGAAKFFGGIAPSVGLPSIPNPLSGVDAIANFLGKLFQASTWLSVVEVIAGAVLVILGLRQLATVAGQIS